MPAGLDEARVDPLETRAPEQALHAVDLVMQHADHMRGAGLPAAASP